MKKKDVYLESIRGIAALVVVLHHLVLAFIPAMKGPWSEVQTHSLAFRLLGGSPLSVVTNGTFAVRLFFVLSGFVLSLSFFKKKQISVLGSMAVRRYPRLMIPVLASVMVAWVIQELHGYRNFAASALMNQGAGSWLNLWYRHPLSFLQALEQGLYGTFFQHDFATTLNSPLWTMPIELAGSFFVFVLLALVGLRSWRVWIYLVLAIACVRVNHYMLDFLVGIALCDLHVNFEKANRLQLSPALAWMLLILGLAIGGVTADFFTYATHFKGHLEVLWPTVGALLVVGPAVFCPQIQKALEHPTLAFLGRISFPLYLLHHIVICSLGCWFYIAMRGEAFSHPASVAGAFLVTIAASILGAWGMYYAVDRPSIDLGYKLTRLWGISSSERK